jgi:UDP-N-acetylglucosamine diphosphorylase / glucose-1-phosphate thymidylyltransferase / UDP-N-acetylgalactosamine diphosphorylase / glucosamine-1-phosphate N-acetyltransferase / galactosamine-1-phosphate N-acetyltransferase
MVVVIPMAGRGSRYSNEGYEIPKPLIPVAGKPMILWALKSLAGLVVSRYIFVLLKEHEERFNVKELIRKSIQQNVEFVLLDDVTEGQLCTVLAAKELLEKDEDVLIASSDTLVENELNKDIKDKHFEGIISVSNLTGDQWSFARTNESGQVVEVAEKVRISDHASTGLYYFRRASDLIFFGEQMLANKEKTRNEYYVIPLYQKMIEAGMPIGISIAKAMWDMGTPAAKENFEKHLGNNE